jgi:carnitine 3-dehydrogenase
VAHPFNPVYLLPLVELVGDAGQTARAAEFCDPLACSP